MRDAAVLSYRGNMPEKFIEQALKSGISIMEVGSGDEGEVLFRLTEKNAEKLIALAERYGLNVMWVKRSAAGTAKRTVLRRLSLIPALLVFVALLYGFSARIWLIEFAIDGAAGGSDTAGVQALSEALSRMNISPGIKKTDVDADDVALSIQRYMPDYAYVGVKLTGVRMLVEAVRELPAPDIYDVNAPRDLVAGVDGIVTHVNVFAGRALVAPGDVVRKGDVLIQGVERVTEEVYRRVCALGEVRARAWLSAEAEESALVVEKMYTGQVSRESELRLLSFSYPILKGSAFDKEDRIVRALPIGGLFLPISAVTTEHRAYEERSKNGDVELIQQRIGLEAQEKVYELLPDGCVMIDKWIDYSMIEGNTIRGRIVLEIEQNIAIIK